MHVIVADDKRHADAFRNDIKIDARMNGLRPGHRHTGGTDGSKCARLDGV